MEEPNKEFDIDLANWALKHFPRTVSNQMVDTWKRKNKMPDWLFHEDRLKVYKIPITLALKLMGISRVEFCKRLGINYKKVSLRWFAPSHTGPDIVLNPKRLAQVEEFFRKVERVSEVSQRNKYIKDVFFFEEYDEPNGKLIAFHFMRTLNHRVTYSDSQVIDGPFSKNAYVGKKIEEFINDAFVQVSKRHLRSSLRKINRFNFKII